LFTIFLKFDQQFFTTSLIILYIFYIQIYVTISFIIHDKISSNYQNNMFLHSFYYH
jgi:hypothetical protein